MAMSKRDRRLLAAVAAAFAAFAAFAATGSIDGAGDVSFLSQEDRDRGAALLEEASEDDVRAALAEVEEELAREVPVAVSSRAVLDVRGSRS